MGKLSAVSLFSGGGGMDIGFIRAGFDVVWAIDNNANAVNSYKKNVSENIVLGDINETDIASIPQADVIIGGPPCQSFSLAGKRNCNDARGRLVWRYLEIIKQKSPNAFVFENVTGLTSAKDGDGRKIMQNLMNTFGVLGYEVNWKIVNSADYGVPQLRKRVIIVGKKKSLFAFPETTHNENGTDNKAKYVSVHDALCDLPLAGQATSITDHDYPQMSELDKFIASHVKPGGNYMDLPDDINSVRVLRLKRDGGHTTCYGRMQPDKPAYTINTFFNRPNVGCNIHYKYDRLITVREAMRLQTFPDDYVLVSSSKQGKNLIVGNAVPPLLAYVIAKRLKEELENEQMD